MKSRSQTYFRLSFAVHDLLAQNVIITGLLLTLDRVEQSYPYMLLFVATNINWIISSYFFGLYRGKHRSTHHFFRKSFYTFSLYFFLTLLFIYFSNNHYSRIFTIIFFSGFGTIIFISRMMYVGTAFFFSNRYQQQKKIVFIGYNDITKKLARHFSLNNAAAVHGYFDVYDTLSTPHEQYLGRLNNCLGYALENEIDEIYCSISPEADDRIYELAQAAENGFIRFKYVPDFRIFLQRNYHVDFASDVPILSLRTEPLEEVDNRIKKRLFDIVFSSVVILLVLSWLVPLIALLIKLDSRGPVFFTQMRSGKNNVPFLCFKFRTLKVNGDADKVQVTKDDKRYTRLGKFLRKTNIDELPQFFNVLQGWMSVVGPRPHMLRHTEEYSKILSDYMVRHYVYPGVTGYAQINGYRGEIREKEQLLKRIEYDIYYMEHWSMWLDLKIIVLTVFKSFLHDENAY
ncbi:undecaprenyl-phosphate glucose phosphotransferase [Segetibacter sp. 3557_3]|uniref:undecaprenyl-phosphate glucose phosphotransferase n=1 Tax=Segetibacter sp. 3557_3 TaxID=2547429 RepID=UPI0010588D80|nr:undecaprenyl-phosphate glucose phosphotransferase [Segetibacter sp. 3557_3]TDH20847.1 undecaprenyl-phosphate glucose phosphotransferase [Segetibacter sp. 3557_3]